MGVAEYKTNIEDIILAIEASYDEGLSFRLASDSEDISGLPTMAGDTDRSFQVLPRAPVRVGSFLGPCWSVVVPAEVKIRYLHDEAGQWERLLVMAASDAADVVAAVTTPPASSWHDSVSGGARFVRATEITKSNYVAGVYTISIFFEADIVAGG